MNHKKSIKLFLLLLGFCLFLRGFYVLLPFPQRDTASTNLPIRFQVSTEASFEVQGKNQCAAFSAAYILRYFGNDAKGGEVYDKLPYKIPVSGYVLPKGIVVYLQSQGYTTRVLKGDINSLQAKLVEEKNPVMVLVGNGLFWQHYMTFVGFDNEKKELYFFDSGRDQDENSELPGNRTMEDDYFLKWWSNGLPLFNHIYITVEQK